MIANVTYWLDKTAAKFPDRTAFADEKGEITFEETQRRAKRIATEIVKKGLFKKPIVIYLDKGIDVPTAFMAVAYSGNFYSPIDTDMPMSRANKIMEILNPALVITTMERKDDFAESGYQGDFLLLDTAITAEIQEEKIALVQRKVIDTDLLYVLFTSGSTGVPKGVTITHRSVIDHIDWVVETFNITEDDRFGNQVPFYFDMSILDIYSTIKSGAATYIIPKSLFSYPVLLLEYLKEKRITTIYWVPSAMIMVSRLQALREVDLSDTLRRVLFAGEVMPSRQLNIWRSYLPNVLYANLYGPTEITDTCVYYIVNREFADEEPIPIGVPMSNKDIIVLDENDELVTEKGSGELCVRGTSLSMGYYNNPEKTKEVFVQNPLNPFVPEIIYRTGDLVQFNEYGEMVYLSRKDYQIKHMGRRIELGEIEKAVSSLQEISVCCCIYDKIHRQIVLFIEEDLEKSYINHKISKLVPEYMLPNRVVKLDKIPINANGKIDRVELSEGLHYAKGLDK
ncbi:MAG: amino acid adenylation domain-containing protein [Kineothrix sp.]|nr:amino acid adenylation domain-containing protein [Kineothrix sp.]